MKLLERDTCLDELSALMRDVCTGTGRIALVSGEAGIGKTVLVDQFARKQHGAVRVLWGTCDALFTPRPLGPLHDIAPQAHGNIQPLLAASADPTKIFSAMLSELQGSPVLVVFEDVHWADEATLDLIRFLGRRIVRTTALLVLTYRDDELGPRHPLRTLLGDLVTSPATRRIAVPPLSAQAVHTLVGQRGIDPAALHRQTGGNPFFVTEVLASGDRLPHTVRDAVLARAARLSPSAQAILQAAAVIGPRIDPWVLAQVTGAEARSVDDCLAIGMLVAHGDLLAFRHELARQTVLESISPSHKIALHRMARDTLKPLPHAHNNLSRLAHHAEAANDRAAVLDYAPAAARQAAGSGANREAAALYSLALRYAEDLPLDTHANLLEEYAQHASHIDRRPEAITARRKAIQLWHAAGDRLKEGENHACLVIMLIGMGRNAEAEQASQAAIALFETQTSAHHLASGYETQAALRLFNSDYAEAIGWCEKVLALDGIDPHTYAGRRARMRKAAASMFLDYERGTAELEQMLHAARNGAEAAPQQQVEVANLFANLGWYSAALYQFHRAEQYLNDGLTYLAERDLDIFRNIMCVAQAITQLYVGDWNRAEHLANHVLQQSGASVISRICALEAIGRLRTRRGDPDVLSPLDEALALATPTGNIQRIGPVRATRAEAAWFAGDRERSLNEACAAYDLAVDKHHPWIVGELAY